MATPKQMIVIFLVIVVAVLPSTILAKDFVVGDESGWMIQFNYQAWAQGKEFHVRDKLVFKYPAGAHNVYKVNGTNFQSCLVPLNTKPLATGNDEIVLATPRRKWYICGVGKHCEVGGQKLFITVLEAELAAPAPSPIESSDHGIATTSVFQTLISALVSIIAITLIRFYDL